MKHTNKIALVTGGIIETDFTREALSHPGAREFMSKNIAASACPLTSAASSRSSARRKDAG